VVLGKSKSLAKRRIAAVANAKPWSGGEQPEKLQQLAAAFRGGFARAFGSKWLGCKLALLPRKMMMKNRSPR